MFCLKETSYKLLSYFTERSALSLVECSRQKESSTVIKKKKKNLVPPPKKTVNPDFFLNLIFGLK